MRKPASSHADVDAWDGARLGRFRRALRNWYAKNARDLPWRRTTDPYRVWISEIMLQQTTVTAVIPYYERFLARFPSVEALAAAEEQDVLRVWEGLGYYSRARNLHEAARAVVSSHGGRFPKAVAALRELPGIGRYTAGAIASFAFDARAPIVEANTLRLYCRLLGYRGDPRAGAGQAALWDFAERIVPQRSPGRFNQALMELGATVCVPGNPRCELCPVRSCCIAFREGTQNEIPRGAQRPEVTRVVEASVAVRKGNTWLLRKRGAKERWAGLWDFPRFALNGHGQSINNGAPARRSSRRTDPPLRAFSMLERQVAELTGMSVALESLATEFEHSVTRYRIRLLCFLAEHRAGAIRRAANLKWVAADEFDDYPLSVTGRRLARHISKLRASHP